MDYMVRITDKNGKVGKIGDIYKHNDNEFVIWQTLDFGVILIKKDIFSFQRELGRGKRYATVDFAQRCGKYSEITGTILINPIIPTGKETIIEDKYIIIDNLNEFDDTFKPSGEYLSEGLKVREEQAYKRVIKELSKTIIVDNEHRVICVNYDDEGYALFDLKWNCKNCAIIEFTSTAK